MLLPTTLYAFHSFVNNDFALALNHGRSLSLHANNSWGIKLLRILKIVLMKV